MAVVAVNSGVGNVCKLAGRAGPVTPDLRYLLSWEPHLQPSMGAFPGFCYLAAVARKPQLTLTGKLVRRLLCVLPSPQNSSCFGGLFR